MKTYVDCGAGVAGDMLLGALIDLGLAPAELERTLQKTIPVKGWRLIVGDEERQKWPAKTFRIEGDRPFGSPEQMKRAVRQSRLPQAVKERALAMLSSLQWAESQAHGHGRGDFDPDGLGLLDTLVDVVGNAWGFWRLGIAEVTASPVNTGRMAPATVHLLARNRIPAYSLELGAELATPTGVAILSHLAQNFASLPTLEIKKAGYGAGKIDLPGRPNVLVLYQGKDLSCESGSWDREPVLQLETAIDDMDPRLYPHVSDLLFRAGALDVWWVCAGMKKGRPGILFSVLGRAQDEDRLVKILFEETTTLGIRRFSVDRWVLPRYHRGNRKIARLPGGRRKSQVEYEIARRRALSDSVSLKKILK